MGRFFAERLQGCGLEVNALDKPLLEEEAAELVPGSDLVLLAVPPHKVSDVLEQLRGVLSPESVLADICSVKVEPLRRMLASHAGPVVGTHPLFGPEPEPGMVLRVALVPGRDDRAGEWLRGLLRQAGLSPFAAEAAEHDRAMAFLQGLNFATTTAYLAAASHDTAISKYMTPSFQRRLDAARKMLNQDGELFQSLFESNPYSQEAVRCYRSYLGLAAGGELDLLLNRACWWWIGNKDPGGDL
jgi:prephenate dehydrogenase